MQNLCKLDRLFIESDVEFLFLFDIYAVFKLLYCIFG